jgi:hypothetical protein
MIGLQCPSNDNAWVLPMSMSRSPRGRREDLLLSLSLGGCATAGSSPMDARAEVPAVPSAYLGVHDLPPKREMPAMTPDERSKLRPELMAARDR